MSSTFFVNDNSSDYRLGNRQGVTAWLAKNVGRTASVSLRGNFQSTGDISGENPAYTMAVQNNMVPTVFPNLRAGQRFDVGAGINISIPNGALQGLRFAVEGLMPVYQSLDGPQLETDFMIVGGFQYAPPR